MVLLLLPASCLLLLLLAPCSCLQVLVFPASRQDGLPSPAARLPSTPPTNITDITFCLWLKLDTLQAASVLTYDLNDTHGLGFTLQEHYGFVKLKNVDLLFDYWIPALPGRWRHYCVVYREATQGLAVYLGGKVTFLREGLGELEGSAFHPSSLAATPRKLYRSSSRRCAFVAVFDFLRGPCAHGPRVAYGPHGVLLSAFFLAVAVITSRTSVSICVGHEGGKS